MSDLDTRNRRCLENDEEWLDPFADLEVGNTSVRSRSFQNGTLLDVSEMAKEAGFDCPVAISSALWGDIHAISEEYQGFEDVPGRLRSMLKMAHIAAQYSKLEAKELIYKQILHTGGNEEYTVKLLWGLSDNRLPVLTLMRPEED